jgi:hypothetical protein
MRSISCSSWLVLVLGSGCADQAPPGDAQLTGASGIDIAESGDEGTAADSGAPDEGVRLDIGGGEAREGCNYVDLLFVIDNSGSMCEAQQGLAAVIPQLVDTIFDTLPSGTDVHVGLTTTSFSPGGQHQQVACIAQEGPAEIEDAYVTDALVGGNGYQGRLFEHDGIGYFAGNTSSDGDRQALAQWFPGATSAIGCDGGAFEFTAAAAAYALDPSNAGTNGGFLRDEGGVLVIFVLSNEVDQSPDDLAVYQQVVRDAKQGCGGDACIVTAGLLAPNCVPSADPMVWRFLNAFGEAPAWGDVNDFAGYAAVVDDALSDAIVETCDEITPVG